MLHSRNRKVIMASALSILIGSTSMQNVYAEEVSSTDVDNIIESTGQERNSDSAVETAQEDNVEDIVNSEDILTNETLILNNDNSIDNEEVTVDPNNVEEYQDEYIDSDANSSLQVENTVENTVEASSDNAEKDGNLENVNKTTPMPAVKREVNSVENVNNEDVSDTYINNSILSAQNLNNTASELRKENKSEVLITEEGLRRKSFDSKDHSTIVVPAALIAGGVAATASVPHVNDFATENIKKITIASQKQFDSFLNNMTSSWKGVFDQLIRCNINFEHLVHQFGTQEMKQYVKQHPAKKSQGIANITPHSYSQPAPAPKPVEKTSSQKAVDFAKSRQGTPYVYGGTTDAGYDCSGFTQAAYRSAGINIPRTAAAQASYGRSVSREELQPGDLIFYGYNGPASSYHAAMYIGNGQVIHSPQSGDHVRVADMNIGPISSMKRPA